MFSRDIEIVNKMIADARKQGENLKTLPVAIYARKSTKDETRISLDTQIKACELAINGCEQLSLVNTFREENTSGYFIEGRKEFKKLLSEVKKGNVKVVIAYSLDRLTRNAKDCDTIDDIFSKAGAKYFLATQSFEDTSLGRLNKKMMLAIAQFEPEQTSEKTTDSMTGNAQECKFNGGRVPYGYKVVESKYVINDNEADAVRMMFSSFLSGKTCFEISQELHKKGYASRGSAKAIPSNTIWNILHNERYTGTYIWSEEGRRKRKYRVSHKNIDEVRIKNGIPQIVSATTFEAVRKKIRTTASHQSRKAKEPYILTGKLKCGCCGKPMHGEASFNGSKKRYTSYKCGKRTNCGTTIRQEYIERATAELLSQLLNSVSKEKNVCLRCLNSLRDKTNIEIGSLSHGIESARLKLVSLTTSLANAKNDESIEIINEQIKETSEFRKELQKSLTEARTSRSSLDGFVKKVKNGGISITAEEILNDKQVFQTLVNEFIQDITINKEDIVFNFVEINK